MLPNLLDSTEVRVLGALLEKESTTPEYYPLTLNALVLACNQKSNRHPITNYDADDVEDILNGLRKKGAAVMVEAGGRVVRYKHTLYDWLKVNKVELAVIAELLLRGSQTEGDLRARAGRMEPLPDRAALQAILDTLAAKDLIVYLSPPGLKRGVVVTHNLYPPNELEREKARHANAPQVDDEPDRPARTAPATARLEPVPPAELAAIRAEVGELREAVRVVSAEVRELKAALGA